MKKFLLALCVATSLGSPVAAAGDPDETLCLAPDDVVKQGGVLGFPVFGRFNDVTNPEGTLHADHVIIFELPHGGMFELVWFDKVDDDGLCFAGNQTIDRETLDDILAHLQRKAGLTV